MAESNINLLEEVEAIVADHFTKSISAEYVYHDYQHTRDVVEAVRLIGEGYMLSEKELEILQIAAWFHDTGFSEGADNHEERGQQFAREYLTKKNYPEDRLEVVVNCIAATKFDANPQNLLEKILRDADLSHLGSKLYWDRCWRVRQELLLTQKQVMTEKEWIDFELNFLQNHQYYTEVARELYNKRKKKYINQLRKHKLRLNPETVELLEEVEENEKKGKKKKNRKKKNKKNKGVTTGGKADDLKQLNLGRGVETMYRTTYRTHVNLSSIADNKANFMLTINSIIIGMLFTNGNNIISRIENQLLIYPIILLLATCLVALIFAIMATRPKVTEGKFTRENIQQKNANLLFFGNFYNMNIQDFHWGMMEMIKDSDFLYSSMTRDLYYLGKVLAKKYAYLRVCYGIFMYGLIASVITLAFVLLFGSGGGGS